MLLYPYLALALLSCPVGLVAQITFEQEYFQVVPGGHSQPYVYEIAENEHKYLVADHAAGTFDLYNLDHTLFMSGIEGPVPLFQEPDFYQAILITRELFDCDPSNIEFAVARTSAVESQFWIVRTDGTILFNEPGTLPFCYGGDCGVGTRLNKGVYNTEDGAKLMLMVFDGTPGEMRFRVFDLCGSIPDGIGVFPESTEAALYPNPSDGMMTLVLPGEATNDLFVAQLFDPLGQLVSNFTFHGQTATLDPVALGLTSGTYTCVASSKGRVFHARLTYNR